MYVICDMLLCHVYHMHITCVSHVMSCVSHVHHMAVTCYVTCITCALTWLLHVMSCELHVSCGILVYVPN